MHNRRIQNNLILCGTKQRLQNFYQRGTRFALSTLLLCTALTASVEPSLAAKSTETVLQRAQHISTGNTVQQFTVPITLTDKDQGKPLTLTFFNGPDSTPAFVWVRVFVSDQANRAGNNKGANGQPTGRMIVNETSFKGTNRVDLNASPLLRPVGTTTLIITGAGVKGASIGWKLTAPVPGSMSVSSVSPTTARGGGLLTINGGGFATNASDNTVYLNQSKVAVGQATATSLQITVPPATVPGKYTVTVMANGAKSTPMPIKIFGMPELTRTDWLAGPCGSIVTIFGKNFSDDPAENNVFFAGNRAKVTAASSDSLTVTVPQIPELEGSTSYVNPTPLDVTVTVGTTPAKGKLTYISAKVGWQQ